MTALFEPLREAATYRSLLFLTAALPLSVVEGALLIAGWTLTTVLLITPAVIAALIGLRAVVGAVAASESALARELIGADIGGQRLSSGGHGFWNRGKVVVADASFWRQQAYLLLRVFAGGPLAIVLVSLIASALYLIGLPFYYRWTQADAGLGGSTRSRRRCSWFRSASPGSCSPPSSSGRSRRPGGGPPRLSSARTTSPLPTPQLSGSCV